MGYSHDIMYDMAMKDIRTAFPEHEGWKRMHTLAGKKNDRAFSFSRRIQGKVEKGIAWVSFSKEISSELSAGLADEKDTPSGWNRKILLIPRSTTVTSFPQDIRIMEMKSFGFDSDGQLVWLTKKKNAMDYPTDPVKTT